MKLERTGGEVEFSEGIERPKQFAIAASREAFRVLSSGLYNQKVLAVVRELSCNAFDAHVAANKKDIPFEIHLPTPFEPFFSVKDYGVGLSHDDVLELYSTYFQSTRSNSNLFVGAMGLGSKSPFCYSEGYTVTSRFNGETRIYSAFIDKDGLPNITQLSCEPTPNVENGLEVMFPVHQNDCWEFKNAAATALEFFDPRPKLNVDLEITEQDYILEGKNWGVRKKAYTHHTETVRAIQGMVQYSIGKVDDSRLNATQRSLIEQPIDIFFEIGELTPAASRETLSNDERTIDNILKALDKIGANIADSIKQQIDKCTTRWEARILIHNLTISGSMSGIVNKLFNSKALDEQYTNFSFSSAEFKLDPVKHTHLTFTEFKARYSTKYARQEKYTDWAPDIRANREILFVIDDVERGKKFISFFLQDYDHPQDSEFISKNRIILISKREPTTTQADFDKEVKETLASLGNPPTTHLSKIKTLVEPHMKKVERGSTASQLQRELLVFDTSRAQYHDDNAPGWNRCWKSAGDDKEAVQKIIDLQDEKYFVQLFRGKPVNDKFKYAKDFGELVEHIVKADLLASTHKQVYGINASSTYTPEKLRALGFVEFFEHILIQLTKQMTQQKQLELSVRDYKSYEFFDELFCILAKDQNLQQTSPLKQFSKLVELGNKAKKDRKLTALAEVVEKLVLKELFKFTKSVEIKDEWINIKHTYSLLAYISDDWRSRTLIASAVVEYANFIDNKNTQQQIFEEAIKENVVIN